MYIINTLDKDPLNLLFYFKILYCFVHINQSDGQVVIQDMIGLCVPCGTKSWNLIGYVLQYPLTLLSL